MQNLIVNSRYPLELIVYDVPNLINEILQINNILKKLFLIIFICFLNLLEEIDTIIVKI